MALPASRRSVMTLYSRATCPYCHRVRMVLAEKRVSVDIINIDGASLPEDLLDLNPYNTLPTLTDRDLVLYNSQIIMEYLEDRYPHPPLMPVDPVSKARTRLFLYRIDHDWYSMLNDIAGGDEKAAGKARNALRDSLTVVAPTFKQKPFFMSDEISLADCSLAPLLWRLPSYGIELPVQAKPLMQYAERMFAREAFRASLSSAEREIR
ncbi:MAG: glutathione S-transferase N-terminal domain-containing protein [Gammaproteobacteria bacterium]|nr:glutathione S-transferase N-terminal domain-containing protein [Gammaproteobacteria bacterium]